MYIFNQNIIFQPTQAKMSRPVGQAFAQNIKFLEKLLKKTSWIPSSNKNVYQSPALYKNYEGDKNKNTPN